MDELAHNLGKATCVAMGLQIFAKHGERGVSAEHDELLAGGQVETDEGKLLEKLGWRWQSEHDCWAIFT